MSPAPTQFHLGFRRSLNGLRGVAILFVLLCHGDVTGPGFGFIAVNTFFVLSGFLITASALNIFIFGGRFVCCRH
jgi:peptidoglycan/LPS O-acetylase OafA/YrhL